ncbi:MAG: M14 family zinc carboxypeptidase, partial [Flavobacteriales bacterium]
MKNLLSLLFLLSSGIIFSQVTLDYYLDQTHPYDNKIPTPVELLGYEVGTWHVSHDKLINYMYKLAEASDRISIETRGNTYEGRPILLLTITSPENHKNIESIQKEHLHLSDPNGSSVSIAAQPLIVYQGFSIHGNEPSGANAGLLAAYHLAASQAPETIQMLKDLVILFDPSFNPDGLQRFAYWANT